MPHLQFRALLAESDVMTSSEVSTGGLWIGVLTRWPSDGVLTRFMHVRTGVCQPGQLRLRQLHVVHAWLLHPQQQRPQDASLQAAVSRQGWRPHTQQAAPGRSQRSQAQQPSRPSPLPSSQPMVLWCQRCHSGFGCTAGGAAAAARYHRCFTCSRCRTSSNKTCNIAFSCHQLWPQQ